MEMLIKYFPEIMTWQSTDTYQALIFTTKFALMGSSFFFLKMNYSL